jgi:Tfp pilus assembly protein PilP
VWASGAAFLAITAVLTLAQSATAPPPTTIVAAARTPQAPAYSYTPDGRRDPFVSLLRRGIDAGRSQGKPADGIAGMLVNDLTLRGVLQIRGQFVALVQGPDTRTYLVRANDRLADGVIRAITVDTIVLIQDVNDPLSPTRQREVRKPLRASVERK